MKQVQLTVEDIRSRFQMKFKGAEGNVLTSSMIHPRSLKP